MDHRFTTYLLHISAVFLLLFPDNSLSSIGINYGQIADNLPSPDKAVRLVNSIGANKVKLYDANPTVLKAFANSGVSFTVGIGNEYLTTLQDPAAAETWVECNIKPYLPATKITSIAIGNEVLTSNDTSLPGCLLPAMQNIHAALVKLNLDQKITVTTAHSLSVLETSYPPSSGTFRGDLAGKMSPVIDFLAKTCSPFLINAYPFFAYERNSNDVSLEFVLFQPNSGVVDSGNNLKYDNMLFAQMDAVYAALCKLGHKDVKIQISETGWPSKGDDNETGASLENAKKYNGCLLKIVKDKKGTPAMPDYDFDIFVFALFNENLKPGPTSERNYGLFKHDGTPAYDLGFVGKSGGGGGGGSGGNGSRTPSPPLMFPPENPSGGYMPISSSAAERCNIRSRFRISIILLSVLGWIISLL